MTSKEALNDIKQWIEYITRLDYVEPEVRNEVKKLLYDAYHKTTPEFKIIEKDLNVLEILKNEADYKKIIVKDGIATFHLDMVLTQDTILQIDEWLKQWQVIKINTPNVSVNSDNIRGDKYE